MFVHPGGGGEQNNKVNSFYNPPPLHKIVLFQTFYSWPVPYGLVARNVLRLIDTEIKSPGTAMRKRIYREYPVFSKEAEVCTIFKLRYNY